MPCRFLSLPGFALFFLPVILSGATPTPAPVPDLPTWKEEIAQGFVPYHQLTVDDFPVRNAGKENEFFIKTFITPHYQYYLYFNRGWVHAYIKQWRVFSGFDRNDSYRERRFKEMKASLPYAQAILDLSEIHARELAAMPPEGFPESRSGSQEETVNGLAEKIKARSARVFAEAEREIDALAKATDQGRDLRKTRQLAAEISRRLQATPEPTPFGLPPETAPSPSASPKPSAIPASTR
ncbi:MAG: hypothetical protein ABI787_01745 [Spartobacteria bacterium]